MDESVDERACQPMRLRGWPYCLNNKRWHAQFASQVSVLCRILRALGVREREQVILSLTMP